MSDITRETVQMMEMLPEREQALAYELVKRLVLAWDPDFTRLTPEESLQLEQAEQSGFLSESEIDWDHLEQYA